MEISESGYLHIKQLLKPEELETVVGLATVGRFVDGKLTAVDASASVKSNMQMPQEGSLESQQIGNIVMRAIAQNPIVQSAIMPKMILPPIVSKYQPGMNYGLHVDSPLMGSQYTIRTDVGMTLFLSDPESYEGGELVIHSEIGEVKYKLAKGDAIIYPTTKLHKVNPVTSGERLAAVTWMQCVVRDSQKREILFKLKAANDELRSANPNAFLNLQQVYSNLIRMWAEL